MTDLNLRTPTKNSDRVIDQKQGQGLSVHDKAHIGTKLDFLLWFSDAINCQAANPELGTIAQAVSMAFFEESAT